MTERRSLIPCGESVPKAKTVRQSSPCFAYVDLLTERVGYAIDHIYGDACKVVSDFRGS